jgi:hypothetical protein
LEEANAAHGAFAPVWLLSAISAPVLRAAGKLGAFGPHFSNAGGRDILGQ